MTHNALLARTSTDTAQGLLATNLVAPMVACSVVGRSMLAAKGGSIVNIGSVVGSAGNEGQSAYAASKSGLLGEPRGAGWATQVGPSFGRDTQAPPPHPLATPPAQSCPTAGLTKSQVSAYT